MTRSFTPQERWERASLRVAQFMRGLYEEKGSSDTRLLEAFFLPDEFTVIGRSIDYDGFGRREHVVPRKVIVEQCHAMLKAGQSDGAIAAFIRQHVRIVHITAEECERLDRRSELGLRQTMPAEWRFGDDLYARLSAASIVWEPLPRNVT